MNIIDIILLVVFGSGTQTGRATANYTLVQANLLYYRLVRFLFILIGLITIGWALNILFDIRSINAFFALTFAISAVIISSRPINLAIVAGAGGILSAFEREKRELSEGMKKFLKIYADIIFDVLAWGSLVFMTLLVVPLRDRPWIIFFGTLAIVVFYKIICQAWNFPGTLAKRIIYRVTQAVIIVCVAIMIPSSLYLKVFGFDIGSALIYSEKDDAIVKASKNLHNAEEKERAGKINSLDEKVRLKTASDVEKDELEKLIRDASLFGKTSELVKEGISKIEKFQTDREEKAKAEAEVKEASSSATKPPMPVKRELVAEVPPALSPHNAQALQFKGRNPSLLHGEYHFDSPVTDSVKFLMLEGSVDILKPLPLENGRNFTIPEGSKLVGILSDQPLKVYQGKFKG
jgi:hypothetical protein